MGGRWLAIADLRLVIRDQCFFHRIRRARERGKVKIEIEDPKFQISDYKPRTAMLKQCEWRFEMNIFYGTTYRGLAVRDDPCLSV